MFFVVFIYGSSSKRQPYLENVITFSDEEIARIPPFLVGEKFDVKINCDCKCQLFCPLLIFICIGIHLLAIGAICGNHT